MVPSANTKFCDEKLLFIGLSKYSFLNLHIRQAAIENACGCNKLQYFADACRMRKCKEVYLFNRTLNNISSQNLISIASYVEVAIVTTLFPLNFH